MSDIPDDTASDAHAWLREKDLAIRVIAAEFAENAARVSVLWEQAVSLPDMDLALARLADLTILLETHIPLEVRDILEVAQEGSEKVAAELEST